MMIEADRRIVTDTNKGLHTQEITESILYQLTLVDIGIPMHHRTTVCLINLIKRQMSQYQFIVNQT